MSHRIRPRPRAGLVALLATLAAPVPSAAQAVDVVELTVADVQAGYASGRFTAVQLTQAFLERIAAYEDRYNAFISLAPDALAVAAALDAEYARSGPRGPMHGVPIVIKDNMDVAGLVTTAGWEGFSAATGGIDMVPSDDAQAVARMRAAGAIILGKTNLPDFALDGTRTRSSVAGETLNPYHVGKVPGGSSGGTATAVNASFAVLGVGTETGGSIQNPASAQALVGVKPTHGLVSLEGVVPVNASYLDVVGPLARSVRDAAIALDVLTEGPGRTAAATSNVPLGGYAQGLSAGSLRGKRFGLFGSGWRTDRFPLDSATQRLYLLAKGRLVALGAEVVEDPFRGSGFVELYDDRPDVVAVERQDLSAYLHDLGNGAAFHSIEEWEALAGREFRPGRSSQAEQSWADRLEVRVEEAGKEAEAYEEWRERLRRRFRDVLQRHDLDGLFFPQASAPARNLVEDPARPDYAPNSWPEVPSNIVNDLGVPVVTLPFSYYADGTPFAVAWIGEAWTEGDLLGYAHVFERANEARRPPSLSPNATH
ncbi:MAG: amidase [Gemmatimonadetes bacterium]|nr:amidase [Gemmatimonadota bacterium]